MFIPIFFQFYYIILQASKFPVASMATQIASTTPSSPSYSSWRVFIFLNWCMIVSLSILSTTSFSMYTTKQSLKYWYSIQLRTFCLISNNINKIHHFFFFYDLFQTIFVFFKVISIKSTQCSINFFFREIMAKKLTKTSL